MYYAVFDNDLNQFLAVGRNKTKRETLEDYMDYRRDDWGEWWEQDCNDTHTPKVCAEISKLSDE